MELTIDKLPSKIGHGYTPLRVLPLDYIYTGAAKGHRRLTVFYHKGLKCSSCDKVGKYVIEAKDPGGGIHIDVYTESLELMTVDHIIPKAKGGKNILTNYQPMCNKCNSKKGCSMPDEVPTPPKTLWEKISEFDLDDPDSSYKFSDRLAKENLWSKEFALRVIEEYKRFCYLAVVAGHTVTPSEEVDQAWHLHLLYTREYKYFTKKILKYELHHGPTRGGKSEGDRFEDLYAETKASYQKHFNSEPPSDIWPSNNERFAGYYVRLDLSRHLVISTERFPRLTRFFKWIVNWFI